ncbi:MAG: CofH family radical SAM protein, partial [Fimbriimonadales bacterium]|nr:CofH family radical SAM protein [Fimbriimonadales bacterium]
MRVLEVILGRELMPLYEKVMQGERLSFEDGVLLYRTPNLSGVGYLANIVRERLNGNYAYYIRNQHINYTNICNKGCKFCSFYAQKGGPKPYTLTMDEVRERLHAYKHIPITEVHIVGGVNPRLPYQYYLDLIRTVKAERPEVHIKAFTAVEWEEIARVAKKPLAEVLHEMKEAGLGSVPGGGIEVLSDRIHAELFPKKINGKRWKEIAREIAAAGLKQYATLLYGLGETIEERVDHFIQLRELQDETGHFLAMTPLSFHPEGTQLSHLPHPSGDDDLRNIAVARLMLDNFPHIKSFWIMNTPAITQIALWYGADDVDGTVHEYEIVYQDDAPGVRQQVLTRSALIRLIRAAGRIPVERDSLYQIVHRPDEEDEAPASRRLLRVV